MRICLYSPYLPGHFGGGEKYMLDVATTLAEQHQVTIAIKPAQQAHIKQDVKDYESFFNISLKNIQFSVSPLSEGSALEKLRWTSQFDRLYYLTDGSLFLSLAKKNILHIQFPFTHSMSSIVERTKLKSWQVKNTNSHFTKKVIESHWPCHVNYVHQPMIAATGFTATQLPAKEKVILSVGRFFRQLHTKRQDVLIEIFKELKTTQPSLMKGWKLVLIGGVEDEAYASELHAIAEGSPIEFYHDLQREDLESWYGRSQLYWHAAGFGIDENKHPEKVEHFGISTVEAMSFGAVPLVVGKGGQIEVLGSELQHNTWQTKAECIEKTVRLLSDRQKYLQDQEHALKQSHVFDAAHFRSTLLEMIA